MPETSWSRETRRQRQKRKRREAFERHVAFQAKATPHQFEVIQRGDELITQCKNPDCSQTWDQRVFHKVEEATHGSKCPWGASQDQAPLSKRKEKQKRHRKSSPDIKGTQARGITSLTTSNKV